MSIKKNNTYFKENDGKIYYYDDNGVKKDVPSTAFSNLQEQIDGIGKPLTYSGSKSVTEINELETIKVGTVYTITGEAGTVTAGNVEAKQGDEIAWGGEPAQWFNIGKDKVDSWKTWSEDHNSSGDKNSVYIGKDLTSVNGGFIIGDVGVDTDLEGFNPDLTKADNGMVITKAFKDIPQSAYEEYGLSYEYFKSPTGALNFKYKDIEYDTTAESFVQKEITDNTKWAASATNGGIAIGRAVTADMGGIAISPKFNSYNKSFNVIGTSASNEGVAIGDGVAATNGGLALGKNGLSASNAAVGIGRIGTANNASILISNDLRETTAKTGNTYCYYDTTEQKYRPVDKTLQQHYYNPQYIDSKKYNPTTSAFENITGTNSESFSNLKMILVNEYDGQIIFCYSYINSTTVSGYYDEDLKFHRVNSQSEVPEGETFVKSHSAYDGSWTRVGSGSVYNDALFTTSFYVYDNSAEYKVTYDDDKYLNLKCYEYYKSNNLYNYLKTKPLLSGYIDPDSMSGKVYYSVYYDDNTKSPTSGELIAENQYIDYLENDHGQKIYIEDVVTTSVSAKFEPVTLANYNGVGIGQNLRSENSILLNTNSNSYVGHIESYSAWSYRYGTALSSTDSKTSNVFKENTFFTNGIIHSSATQPIAQGESILLSPNGKNVYAYGESLLLGRVDTTAIGRSIAIGNRQSACNASLAIGYADEYDGSNGLFSAMCNSALNKSMSIGILNFAVNYSVAFGRYNSAYQDGFSIGKSNYTYGDTYAFGERNYISTGKSILVGYENSAMGSFEGSIFGFRNKLNGGSVQVSLIGYQNSASCGNIQGIIGGNNNSAGGSSLQTVILGTNNYCSVVSIQGVELGCNNRISCGSVRGTVIGVDNSASMSTFDGVLIGNCNTASYSETQSVIIGNSNSGAIEQGVLLGQNNSALGNPLIIGFSSRNIYPSRDIMYGYYNLAEGESFVFGNYNNATTGGHNLALGIENTASNESIGIGRYNAIKGHGIAIGWYNQGSAGDNYNHSILMGYTNSANNNIQQLNEKYIDVYNIIHYSNEAVNNATTRYYNAYTEATGASAFINQYVNDIDNNSEYIDIGIPEYYYDSVNSAILPYNSYDTSKYILLPSNLYPTVHYEYYKGNIPKADAKRYKFVGSYSWNNLINLVNDRTTLLPIYTEFTAASAEYETIVLKNNSYGKTETSVAPETNSLVVGTNNSAAHHNSYLLGSYNQSLSSTEDVSNDDGFVYAMGLGNIVGRNYDIAIGHKSIASGGQNLALNSSAFGQCNIAINNSYILGNSAYNKSKGGWLSRQNVVLNNSYLMYSGADANILSRAYLYQSSADAAGYYAKQPSAPVVGNLIANISDYSYGPEYDYNEISTTIGLTNNIIFGSKIIDTFATDSIIFGRNGSEGSHSPVLAGSVSINSIVGFDSIINDSTIHRSIIGFGSSADSAFIEYSLGIKSTYKNRVQDSISIGAQLSDCEAVIAIADKSRETEENCEIAGYDTSLILGDNWLSGGDWNQPAKNVIVNGEENRLYGTLYSTFLQGHKNYVNGHSTNYIFINGEENTASNGQNNTIFGKKNRCICNSIYGAYNNIRGEENIVGSPYSEIYDNTPLINNTIPNIIYQIPDGTIIDVPVVQSLSRNSHYIKNNNAWMRVTERSSLYSYINDAGQINYIYSDSIVSGYMSSYTKTVNDFISLDDYKNLSPSEQAAYTGTSAISIFGDLKYFPLRYRSFTLNSYSYVHLNIKVLSAENSYYTYQHITKMDPVYISTNQQSLDSSGVLPDGTAIIPTDYVTAHYGCFSAMTDCLIEADATYPNLWSKNYQSTDVYESTIIGKQNYIAGSIVNAQAHGTRNIITGSRINNVYLYGEDNKIVRDQTNFTLLFGIDNNVVNMTADSNSWTNGLAFGQHNYIEGPQAYTIGSNNTAWGPVSYAFGESIISNKNQMVVGKYNISLDSPTVTGRTKNSNNEIIINDTTSGAVFVVGNGYYDSCDENGNNYTSAWSNPAAIHRSNAMIVSADGTVSAKRFVEANPDASLQELITLLHNKPATESKYIIGLDEQGTLTWVPVTV